MVDAIVSGRIIAGAFMATADFVLAARPVKAKQPFT